MKINIVGVGVGSETQLTIQAQGVIKKSAKILADKRLIQRCKNVKQDKFIECTIQEIYDYIDENIEVDEITILVSGDVGFYSLSKVLFIKYENKHNIELICGISSLQYFCARIKTSWNDVNIVSLHGRETNIIGEVINNHKTFVLTDSKMTPKYVCEKLCNMGLSELMVSVGENLSYENERIITDIATNLKFEDFSTLSVMLIVNQNPISQIHSTHGVPDNMFVRGQTPMTKQEIRAISLAKLMINNDDIIYDIGAGTGSVSIEMSLRATYGFVYAIEMDTDAIDLIKQNKEKFGALNIKIISNKAPDGLEELPPPQKVFIGGTKGNLNAILDCVYKKNENTVVVINAITLETLNEAVNYYKNNEKYDTEIINVSISKSRKIGNYNMMTGQNPIFIISAYLKD